MKRALKIIWKLFLTVAVLLFAVWILIQIPAVQTFVAKRVTSSLEENFGGTIEFSKIHLKPFNAIVLKDVRLIDSDPPITTTGEVLDTLASAKSITASFSLRGLLRKEGIHLGKVVVSGGTFTYVSAPEGSNIKRFFGSSGKEKEKEKKEMGRLFDARKVLVDDFRFRMVNLKHLRPSEEGGINWTDLDITVRQLEATDLKLADGYMKGEVEKLTAVEKSGYQISSITGKTTVGGGRALIEDLRLRDKWSDIKMEEFSLNYQDIGSFNNFIEEVRITGDIRSSRVDFKSLSYFATALKPMNVHLNVSRADVDGTVSDLGIDRIEFSESGSGVSGYAAGRITGLPDIYTTVLDFDVERLSFTSEGLGRFVGGFAPSAKLSLGKFAPGEKVTFDGSVHGTLNHLAVNGGARTAQMGSLKTNLLMRDLISKNNNGRVFSGDITTHSLDIGRIAGVKQLGELTMRAKMDATLGKNGINLKIDSLSIDKLQALGYDYSNIMAVGTYTDKAFDGRLVCNDPNLNFLFQGIFTLSDKTSNGLYKFYANVGYADLQALGLDKRGVSKVAGRIDANYMTVPGGDIIGDLDIKGLDLENSLGRHDIGDISITSHSSNGLHRVNLDSRFADGSYVGSKSPAGIVKDLRELTLLKELPVLCKDTVRTWNGDRYNVNLDIHDSRDILSFVMPGLYIADSTKVRLSVSRSGEVKSSVKSSRIAMGKNYLRNIDLAFDNKGGSLNGALTGSELAIGGIMFKNNNLSLYASDNHAGLGYSYDNDSDVTDKGEIYLSGEFARNEDGELLLMGQTLPSSIWFNDQEWVISPSSINLFGKNIKVDNLSASSGSQSIKVDGGFASTGRDTLSLDLVRFDMGLANKLLGDDYGIGGLATGRAVLRTPLKNNLGISAYMMCDSVRVGGKPAGSISLNCETDSEGRLNILADNLLNGSKTFGVTGFYSMRDKSMDIKADLAGMEAGYLSPVLASIFSDMGGRLNGKVSLQSQNGKFSITSEDTRFDNVMLKVAYTNVPYFANGPFKLDNGGLHLDGVAVRDRFDGTGVMSGGVLFDHLKDIRMDTGIKMTRMEALDLDPSAGEAIYGNVFATGSVSIKGPFNAIMLEVDARTDKSGSIHIPIDQSSSDANTNLLRFKEPVREVYIDPYEVMMNRLVTESRKESDFGIHLKINANQRTEAYVEIDRSAGNALVGRGQGNIDINVRPSNGVFAINGDYTLESGNFHFNALDIAKRDFTLSQGSSIRFNGDVMDSDLNIEGLYTTKASVATLIADTSAVSTRKIVNCGIGISGKLREPQLTFSVNVPDLDPATKSKVESALNTEDKVQRQFLSLLISGSFMPEEQSGIVNNTSTLYTNLAEIMAGQLNSILQKLDIPLDFGLNYQSSETGNNIFDVAVSTQLFNNRVIVNGNVGNREYSNTSQGDVVGDLDIEIKLDKPGQVRLNLFSHSQDDYTNFLDNLQRNGAGITYQKEFSTLKELIRSIFNTRKRRQERALAPPTPRELNSISITE